MLVIIFTTFAVRVLEAEAFGDEAWGKWLREGRTCEGPLPYKAYLFWREACQAGQVDTLDLR